jgi:hypothetical protein
VNHKGGARKEGNAHRAGEYILIGFPGNQFKGEIAAALARLIDGGTVRIIDLLFIGTDSEGNIRAFEFDQLDELAPFAALQGEAGGLLNEEDVAYAAAGLEPNSSAALIVWEDTWAAELAEAVCNANGVVLDGARIPHDLADAGPT